MPYSHLTYRTGTSQHNGTFVGYNTLDELIAGAQNRSLLNDYQYQIFSSSLRYVSILFVMLLVRCKCKYKHLLYILFG